MADKHVVDQRQIKQDYAYLINDTRWLAQSFVPTLPNLSKVELCLIAWKEGYDVEVAIKDGIDGKELAKTSKIIEPTDDWRTQWVSFSFIDVELIPGKEYYIVCRSSKEGWGVAWVVGEEAYDNGMFYTSRNAGNEWREVNQVDACFVTYGAE